MPDTRGVPRVGPLVGRVRWVLGSGKFEFRKGQEEGSSWWPRARSRSGRELVDCGLWIVDR